jgi:hypothetical protein
MRLSIQRLQLRVDFSPPDVRGTRVHLPLKLERMHGGGSETSFVLLCGMQSELLKGTFLVIKEMLST